MKRDARIALSCDSQDSDGSGSQSTVLVLALRSEEPDSLPFPTVSTTNKSTGFVLVNSRDADIV